MSTKCARLRQRARGKQGKAKNESERASHNTGTKKAFGFATGWISMIILKNLYMQTTT
jgi:hypothetical protein